MKNFAYYAPKTVDQAVALLDAKWGKTELLGGGTDLLDLQKEYVAQPEKVISLGGVAGLGTINIDGGRNKKITIGAGVTLAAIAEHVELKKLAPALTSTAGIIGGPQIRNMGTLGGNLCQRNRCWYFRDEHVPCLLKGGAKCFALAPDSENRYHAIFTQGHKCVMVNPSTLAPVLIALGAEADIQGPKGKRILSLAKFFQAPNNPEQREHVLEANEVVTAVRFEIKDDFVNASYEVRQKQSHDWPLVQAAVSLESKGGIVRDVRIVLGHVAPTPLLVEAAAKQIEGKEVSEATAEAAGKAATEGAKPLGQNAYKVQLIQVAVKRALFEAVGKRYWE